jgi:hypothetical protein
MPIPADHWSATAVQRKLKKTIDLAFSLDGYIHSFVLIFRCCAASAVDYGGTREVVANKS